MNTIADKIVPGVINTITPDKLPQGTIPAGEHDKIVVLQVDENGKYKYKALPPEAFQGIQGKPGENAITNINARGVWDADILFAKNDLVMCQDGNAYISIIDDNIGIYPPNYTNAWTRFVARGANGFGIIGSNIQYQIGSSGTSQPTGTWTDSVPETTGANQFLWTRTQFIREIIDGTVLETAYSVGRIGIDAPQVRFQYSVDGVSDWADVFNNTHVFLRTSVDDGNTWSDAMRFRGLDGAVLSVNGRTGNVEGLVEDNDARLRNNYVMHERWVDATGLDENMYYPVIFDLSNGINTRIELDVNLHVDNGIPSWSTHGGGFAAKVIWENHGFRWGGNAPPFRRVHVCERLHSSVDPAGSIGQLTYSSKEFILVRGGGRYRFFVSQADIIPELHPNGFEMHGQRVDPQSSVTPPVVNTVTPDRIGYVSIPMFAGGDIFDIIRSLTIDDNLSFMFQGAHITNAPNDNWNFYTVDIHNPNHIFITARTFTGVDANTVFINTIGGGVPTGWKKLDEGSGSIDQENGTWTPSDLFGAGAEFQSCNWQRIGNVVHFQGGILFNSASTNFVLSGVPFIPESGKEFIVSISTIDGDSGVLSSLTDDGLLHINSNGSFSIITINGTYTI